MKTYHGWIVVEKGDRQLQDTIYVEFAPNAQPRQRQYMGYGESGCVGAVEWWDKKVGKPVKLEPALRGCYRVYTE